MNLNYYEILSEIIIDNYSFKITWTAAVEERCILWLQDTDTMEQFEALGSFGQYDKRNILEFVVRYVTSQTMREEIGKKRFLIYRENLSPTYFEEIQKLGRKEKVAAFSNLLDLDSIFEPFSYLCVKNDKTRST
jgi:hypothetical protein